VVPRLKILYFFLDLILPLTVGYILCRRPRVMRVLDKVMVVNLMTLGPVLSTLSFWAIQLRPALLWLPFLGLAMQLIPGGVAFLRARRKFVDPRDQGSYILSTMLSNRGTVGVLTAFLLLGEASYAPAQLIMLLAPAVTYFFCFPLAQRFRTEHGEHQHSRPPLISSLFNRNMAPALGIIAGLALNYSGMKRPDVMATAFPWLLHANMWLFILPLGAAINLDKMHCYWRDICELLGIKFVLTPAVVYALARLANLARENIPVVVILACAPTAILAVVAVKLHDLNIHLAMAAFVLTTLTYLVVILPALGYLFG